MGGVACIYSFPQNAKKSHIKKQRCQVWWCMPVFLYACRHVFLALGRGRGGRMKSEVCLDCLCETIVRPCLTRANSNNKADNITPLKHIFQVASTELTSKSPFDDSQSNSVDIYTMIVHCEVLKKKTDS